MPTATLYSQQTLPTLEQVEHSFEHEYLEEEDAMLLQLNFQNKDDYMRFRQSPWIRELAQDVFYELGQDFRYIELCTEGERPIRRTINSIFQSIW